MALVRTKTDLRCSVSQYLLPVVTMPITLPQATSGPPEAPRRCCSACRMGGVPHTFVARESVGWVNKSHWAIGARVSRADFSRVASVSRAILPQPTALAVPPTV